MKRISIIVTPGCTLSSIDNPRRGFLFVNTYLQNQGKPSLFDVELVGLENEVVLSDGLCTLHPDSKIAQVNQTDLIIIPAYEGDIATSVQASQAFIPWLVKQYHSGAEIASLCMGAFLLGATGLLDDKSCSTHWKAAHQFQKMYPHIHLKPHKIITDEEGIYTSGGAFSAANLVLYIIEKYAGREIAIACSKMFEIDYERNSQSPFMIFHSQKDHQDQEVKKIQNYIEQHYKEKLTVSQLAKYHALSRRSLERRFKKATANTLIEYIQRVKIEAVKKRMEKGRETVNELMYEVGYNDPKSFRNLFKRHTGLTPVAYKNKYSKALT